VSDKDKSSRAEGCGRLLGSVACWSLVGGVYGQVLRWAGVIECDWTVVWGPAVMLWFGLLFVFAAAGAILTAKDIK
jgi:hypothetical protein